MGSELVAVLKKRCPPQSLLCYTNVPCRTRSQMAASREQAALKAARSGETQALLEVLQHGAAAEVEAGSSLSSQALLWAASGGWCETIDALVTTCRADTAHQSDDGWTATTFAARHGHTAAAVKLVCEHGANVDHAAGTTARTALMYAACHGHSDTVAALVRRCGADVQRQDANGWSARMYAEAAGHAETVKLLDQLHAERGGTPPPLVRDVRDGASEDDGCIRRFSEKRALCQTPPDGPEPYAGIKRHMGHRRGVRIISSHMPRKVSTPPKIDQLPAGPCAQGGGLWTIREAVEAMCAQQD